MPNSTRLDGSMGRKINTKTNNAWRKQLQIILSEFGMSDLDLQFDAMNDGEIIESSSNAVNKETLRRLRRQKVRKKEFLQRVFAQIDLAVMEAPTNVRH